MKNTLGIVAIVIGVYSYIPYFRDILAGTTKPHAFTWFVWFLLTALAYGAQVSDGAGAGAWVTGFTAVVALAVTITALKVARQNIVALDWVFFVGSLAALGLWLVTKDPVGSVVLITLIDALAFVPTFRKSFHKPQEETASTYALSALKFGVSLAALSTMTLTTSLYPLSLVVTNGLFVTMITWRRKRLSLAPNSQPF
jgi:hypothetical protein